LAVLAGLLTSTLMTRCGSSTLKIGWREFSGLKRKRASYVTFDGVQNKTVRAEAGKTIDLACDVSVDKGTLTTELIAPDGETLWKDTFREDREAFVNVTATEDGLHILRIEGEETGGSFDISWRVKS
jgi:hypothetical protein